MLNNVRPCGETECERALGGQLIERRARAPTRFQLACMAAVGVHRRIHYLYVYTFRIDLVLVSQDLYTCRVI